MNHDIRITGAGAGTGKTFQLCEIISEALGGEGSGDEPATSTCSPGGFIATTFTRKAAAELTERVRGKLLEQGLEEAALRVEEALVGTVHSVCMRLLERFAYEAGISPVIRVMDEAMESSLIGSAIEDCLHLDEISRMESLANRLEQREQDFSSSWKKQIRNLISTARSNRIEPQELSQMGKESLQEIMGFLPPETSNDLDTALRRVIQEVIPEIEANTDTTKTTEKVVVKLRDTLRQLDQGTLAWSTWWSLVKASPGKKSADDYQPVADVAKRVEEHPQLRKDLEDYSHQIHKIAVKALEVFQQHKKKRGMLDYSDLEVLTLELLEKPEVCDCLRDEYDLLVIDEFQDTSPIQLALFLKLAGVVKTTHWVGDTKQAIYGFRGCDPRLMDAAEKAFRVGGNTQPLNKSYRHRPELVTFFNSLFPGIFAQTKGIKAEEVKMLATRPPQGDLPPAVELWHLQSDELTAQGRPKAATLLVQHAAAASGIRQLIDSKVMVSEKATQQGKTDTIRPMKHKDIAVLCRTNGHATSLTKQIQALGLPVARRTSGLLSTPEAGLALACLRWLGDNQDSLAAAEVLALESGETIDQWLEERLSWLEGDRKDAWGLDRSPLLQALATLREDITQLTPAELLDAIIARGGLARLVSQWGPAEAEQKRANLEALRGMASRYQDSCCQNSLPATHSGFLVWCDHMAQKGDDVSSVDESRDAIQVMTWHASKGLEWPVVICLDLDREPQSRHWNETREISPEVFNPVHPLVGRRLAFRPYPFGKGRKDIPLAEAMDASPIGKEAMSEAASEESRLHYVVMTRARDLLIFPVTDKKKPWLPVGIDCPFFDLPEIGAEVDESLPTPRRIRRLTPSDPTPPEASHTASWFEPPQKGLDLPPADLTPSGVVPVPVQKIAPALSYGGRPTIASGQNNAALGDSFHASLATYLNHPGIADFERKVETIFEAHEIEADISGVSSSIRTFHDFLIQKFHPSELLVEVPFTCFNAAEQRITGFIDLVLLTREGAVIIDHKSYLGKGLDERAARYSGQLDAYQKALQSANHSVVSTWVHWCSQGALQEVTLP